MTLSSRAVLAFVCAVACAREGHVSGGFRECYTDVDGVLCVESDVRKAFRDAAQADEWLASRRSAAEWRLRTAIPALRTALVDARAAGLPLAAVDDWRLPPARPAATGPRRERLDLGMVERDLHSLTLTTTRALRDDERAALIARLQQALATLPPPKPARSDDDDDNAVGSTGPQILPRPLRPVTPLPPELPPVPPPGPALPIEDVATWTPLFVVDDGAIPLAIGVAARVSPLAQARWRPWLTARVRELRQAFSTAAARCALPASRPTARGDTGFADVEGFRPWGPLLLGTDVQARVDDGELVRMARIAAADERAAELLYGQLSACIADAARASPLPAPPH